MRPIQALLKIPLFISCNTDTKIASNNLNSSGTFINSTELINEFTLPFTGLIDRYGFAKAISD